MCCNKRPRKIWRRTRGASSPDVFLNMLNMQAFRNICMANTPRELGGFYKAARSIENQPLKFTVNHAKLERGIAACTLFASAEIPGLHVYWHVAL